MKRKVFKGLILLIVFVTTFWFSAKPGRESANQSSQLLIKAGVVSPEDVAKRTKKYRVWYRRIRKTAHFSLYFVAGVGAFFLTGSVRRSVLIAFIMGGIDEIHQYFVPGRGAQFTDVLIDILGGTTGAIVTKLIINNYKLLMVKRKQEEIA